MTTEVLVAILSILVGLLLLFYGYPIFRFMLPLIGLLLGYYVGRQLFPDQQGVGIVIGIVLGLIFAGLSYFAWSLLVALAGIIMGFFAGVQLAYLLGLASPLSLVFGIVGAILFGIIYLSTRDLMVMLQLAISGASLVLNSLVELFPQLSALRLTSTANIGALLVWTILIAVGFLFQWSRFGTRHLYVRRRVIA